MRHLIITIDGPSGAGKSTMARRLAETLGYTYLDTGAMYRALAFASFKYGRDPEEIIGKVDLVFNFEKETKTLLEGEDISSAIRDPFISMLASEISKRPKVREFLKEMQRRFGKEGGIVAEGRDMGTVVFPEADVKFYLDADPEERARRRYRELLERGKDVQYERIKEETMLRDKEDSERELAPLVCPPDSVRIDTTHMSEEEVLKEMLRHIEERVWKSSRQGT